MHESSGCGDSERNCNSYFFGRSGKRGGSAGLCSTLYFYKIHGGKNASLRSEGANPCDRFQRNRREYALYHDGYFGRVFSGK